MVDVVIIGFFLRDVYVVIVIQVIEIGIDFFNIICYCKGGQCCCCCENY